MEINFKMDLKEVRRKYLEFNVYKFLVSKQIDDINQLFIIDLKSRGIIPNVYSCQRCGNELVTETEVPIILGQTPLCMGCLGNVTITRDKIEQYIVEHKLGEIEDDDTSSIKTTGN
jgi:hypothetical protein